MWPDFGRQIGQSIMVLDLVSHLIWYTVCLSLYRQLTSLTLTLTLSVSLSRGPSDVTTSIIEQNEATERMYVTSLVRHDVKTQTDRRQLAWASNCRVQLYVRGCTARSTADGALNFRRGGNGCHTASGAVVSNCRSESRMSKKKRPSPVDLGRTSIDLWRWTIESAALNISSVCPTCGYSMRIAEIRLVANVTAWECMRRASDNIASRLRLIIWYSARDSSATYAFSTQVSSEGPQPQK